MSTADKFLKHFIDFDEIVSHLAGIFSGLNIFRKYFSEEN
jgi:hypothetical protein